MQTARPAGPVPSGFSFLQLWAQLIRRVSSELTHGKGRQCRVLNESYISCLQIFRIAKYTKDLVNVQEYMLT